MKVGSCKEKPKIGVSSCLLGHLVRYDGREKLHPAIHQLSAKFELIPLCPEVDSGLSTPRPPVQLVKSEGHLLALGVEEPTLDITERLENHFHSRVEMIKTLSGLILKARSPSCGTGSTPIYSTSGEEIEYGSGLFSRALKNRFPHLPLIDEIAFDEPRLLKHFLQQVKNYSSQPSDEINSLR